MLSKIESNFFGAAKQVFEPFIVSLFYQKAACNIESASGVAVTLSSFSLAFVQFFNNGLHHNLAIGLHCSDTQLAASKIQPKCLYNPRHFGYIYSAQKPGKAKCQRYKLRQLAHSAFSLLVAADRYFHQQKLEVVLELHKSRTET